MGKENEPVLVSGIKLEAPVMVGAGPIKAVEQVREIAESQSAAIIVGSITLQQRLGNEGKTYYRGQGFALNSKGLPNPGLHAYREMLPDMVKIAHDHGKPIIVSVAGFSPKEYARLAETVLNYGVDGVELNLGCPNLIDKQGKQKQIVSFSEDLTGETLLKVAERVGSGEWVSVKLSPFSDPQKLTSIAEIIEKSYLVRAVVSTNTFPNALAFDGAGDITIDPAGGLSGLSGKAMKPIGLGQVKQLRTALPDGIAVIGVGGIASSRDVEDYLNAGAIATQITTAYLNLGPLIFELARGLLA